MQNSKDLPVDVLIEKSFNILGGIAQLKITQGLARKGKTEGFESNVELTYSKTTEVNGEFDTQSLTIVDDFSWGKQSIVDFQAIKNVRISMQEQAIDDVCKKFVADNLSSYMFDMSSKIKELEGKL